MRCSFERTIFNLLFLCFWNLCWNLHSINCSTEIFFHRDYYSLGRQYLSILLILSLVSCQNLYKYANEVMDVLKITDLFWTKARQFHTVSSLTANKNHAYWALEHCRSHSCKASTRDRWGKYLSTLKMFQWVIIFINKS